MVSLLSNIDYEQVPEIINEFLLYLGTVKNKSQNTIKEYYLDLRTFFRFLKVRRKLVDENTEFKDISIKDVDLALVKSVTITDIYEFMNYSITNRNNSAKTRARKASSLKTFFKYHTQKSLKLDDDPTKNLETPKIPKKIAEISVS